MAVVFPCLWLHFRPKHLLKGFLEHFWVFPKLRGLLGGRHRAEGRARARVQSGVLITDFKLPPRDIGSRELTTPLTLWGGTREYPALPDLASCPLVSQFFAVPSFLCRCVCLPSYLAAFFWQENLILIPSLSVPVTSPAHLWLKHTYVALNVNSQSRTSTTDRSDCVGLEHRTQVRPIRAGISGNSLRKMPNSRSKAGTVGGHLVLPET